ncbi:MAG: ATP-binding protein [Anaerolineales bacterium]|jgi:signal transduction histidine kinase
MSPSSEILSQFDAFSGLPKEACEQIAQLASRQEYSKEALLFSEDTVADNFYLLLSGKVSLEKLVQLGRTGTPRRATTNIIGPGHALGWSSLVRPFEYTSSAICLEDTVCLVIPGEDLRRLMSDHPDIGYTVLGKVSSIIRGRMTNATETLTYFLSIVSHELKRPLAAVENYLQILIDGYAGEISPKQKRLMERCTLRLIDLRTLISDILDFARIQPDQIRSDFEWVDPLEIGTEAFEEVRIAAAQKGIQLKATGPSEYQRIVAARRRLRQVISNLLANAIKFSPDGSTVTLAASDEKDCLIVQILDEGIGIPPEDQENIFDDFFRGSNAAEFGGAGLGLSIAKKIVEAHEGTISVESPYLPNKTGTKFTVVIPRTLIIPESRGVK